MIVPLHATDCIFIYLERSRQAYNEAVRKAGEGGFPLTHSKVSSDLHNYDLASQSLGTYRTLMQ